MTGVKKPKSAKSLKVGKHVAHDDEFAEDFANFFRENATSEEEEEHGESAQAAPPMDTKTNEFWKTPQLPEKYPLDHVNVENLVNMLSKIRLVWPEDLPYYDETEFTTDPTRAKYPLTFYHNSDKEKVVLWHAENFRRQILYNFPDRRPLVIAPRNECGCQKLFPTYINPTTIGYPEFLDCLTTVEFLKDFFKPQLMNPPTKVPEVIRSHMTVIRKRDATALEMAIIAVSSLIGSGYDAYVVDGYASKTLCVIDTTEDYHEAAEKPILAYEIENTEGEEDNSRKDYNIDYGYLLESQEEEALATVSPDKYRFKPKGSSTVDVTTGGVQEGIAVIDDDDFFNMGLMGGFRTGVKVAPDSTGETTHEPEEVEGDDSTLHEEGDDEEEGEDEEEGGEEEESEIDEELPSSVKDRYHGKRTHAWILVRPGKRDVEKAFFLEPFTGTMRPIKDPNFLAIEAMFNQHNYWVNIQPPPKNLRRLNYDLDNSSAWSKLLEEPTKKKKVNPAEGPAPTFDDEEEDEAVGKGPEMILTMPVSWTTELEVSQEDYDRRFPAGTKQIEYNDAIVELAAPFVNEDGLVRKVLKFSGASRDPDDLDYIEEDFEHRKDKLVKRKWMRDGKVLHEYFGPGRKDALKEHVHVSGRNKPDYPRDLYYYSNAHPRNIAHRQIIKKGMIEHFEDREDLLYYKLTLFGGIICNTIPTKEEEQKSKARQILELVRGGGSGSKKRARRNITKIVEKYKRNNSKPANEDIAEKHMLIEEGRIRILYHYAKGNFTRNTLEFFKSAKGQSKYAPIEFQPEDCIEYQADRNAEPMDIYKKFLLLQLMDKAERESSVLAREAEDEVYQTVSSRVQEDWRHEIEPDAFAGDKNEEYLKMMKEQQATDENDADLDLSGTDFTTPFFEKYGVPHNKKDEILMKKRIMLHEKVKILRKAYMIKELYEKESVRLKERQEWYARHVDLMNPTQEEDFTHLYKERLFQMHILEQRMIRHQQETPRQYYNLLVQLLRHPQLNRYTNKKVPPPPIPARQLTEEEKARIARELAKLKDCCQFYNIRFLESRKRQRSKPAPTKEVTTEGEGTDFETTPLSSDGSPKKQSQDENQDPSVEEEEETEESCF